jgi:hypothetical protein
MDISIENIDDLIKKKSNNTRQLHPLAPIHPARMIITGSSGGGKTNFLVNLILKCLYFDRIYMYSKHLHQDKYTYLLNHLILLEESCKNAGMKKSKIVMKWEDNLSELVGNDALDKKYANLIVLDDFPIPSKSNKLKIAKLYTSCRHKNTSIITLSQMYFQLERSTRLNLSYAFIGNNGNKKELSLLTTELACELSHEQFKKMYKLVHSEKYQMLMIDNETKDDRLKYRKNLDQPIDINAL